MIIFIRDIYSVEKVDITKLPTNSSIAFKIFRTNSLIIVINLSEQEGSLPLFEEDIVL